MASPGATCAQEPLLVSCPVCRSLVLEVGGLFPCILYVTSSYSASPRVLSLSFVVVDEFLSCFPSSPVRGLWKIMQNWRGPLSRPPDLPLPTSEGALKELSRPGTESIGVTSCP